MRISQLAERTGVSATTLRFYDDAGLLPADRTSAGYRIYGDDAVDRLMFIGSAKHLGLPLEEIGELLAVWESGACQDVKADLRPRLAARLDDAERRVAELAALTASLRSALEHLDTLPDRAAPCGPECGLLSSTANGRVDVPLSPRYDAAEPGAPGPDAERWRAQPVACSLTGDGQTERISAWHAALDGAERKEIPDGLRLSLPADRAATVAGLAAAEQQCCPFFDFRLHLDGPVLNLEIRAPAEGAGLLAELFGPAA